VITFMPHFCRGSLSNAFGQTEGNRQVTLSIPLAQPGRSKPKRNGRLFSGIARRTVHNWEVARIDPPMPHLSQKQTQYLFDAVLRTLVFLSPAEVYAGPLTYKRFWFRDEDVLEKGSKQVKRDSDTTHWTADATLAIKGGNGGHAMHTKKRIVIVEDQTIVRQGLKALFASSDDLEVVAEASDGLQAIRCVQKYQPDLVLTDLSMPKMNGIAAIKEIKRQAPGIKILALTVHDTDDHVLAAFEAGADGYCLKDATQEELMTSVRGVLMGKTQMSPDVAERVLEGYLEGKKQLKTKTTWDTLTQREKEVLKLIGEGYRSKRIADTLCISWKTVEKHRANIMAKLDIHTSTGLAAYAIDKGLVSR
jgi:two-component system response regulator NreC